MTLQVHAESYRVAVGEGWVRGGSLTEKAGTSKGVTEGEENEDMLGSASTLLPSETTGRFSTFRVNKVQVSRSQK